MKKRALATLNVVLAICLLTALFFASGTLMGRGGSEATDYTMKGEEYDPFYDVNDDGTINMKDIYALIRRFSSSGESFITKAGLTYDSEWRNITDKCGQHFNVTHNLNSTDLIVDITGKTTIDGGVHQRHLGLTGYTPGWWRTYGGAIWEEARSLIQTNDGGYALAGSTGSKGPGEDDFWLIKTDFTGELQWDKTYGGTADDRAMSVVQTTDGGYAIAGGTYSTSDGRSDVWLIKTDWAGNAQWNKTYGRLGSDESATSLVQTSDGGYAIAGPIDDPHNADKDDFLLVKTDSDGNRQWNNTYGGPNWEVAWSMVQTSDGGYALVGPTKSYGPGGEDFWLVKTDSAGNMQWNRTYGDDAGDDTAFSIVETSDGGYAIAGLKHISPPNDDDFWLVKTNSTGHEQWNRTYGGPHEDEAYSLIQTSDRGYAMAGLTRTYGTYGEYDTWLVKTDSTGNKQWNRTYGSIIPTRAYSIVETADGGYAIAGRIDPDPWAGDYDVWLVRTEVESGLGWTDSTADTITLYRGATDPHWNHVRVRIWKIKETP